MIASILLTILCLCFVLATIVYLSSVVGLSSEYLRMLREAVERFRWANPSRGAAKYAGQVLLALVHLHEACNWGQVWDSKLARGEKLVKDLVKQLLYCYCCIILDQWVWAEVKQLANHAILMQRVCKRTGNGIYHLCINFCFQWHYQKRHEAIPINTFQEYASKVCLDADALSDIMEGTMKDHIAEAILSQRFLWRSMASSTAM